MEDSPHPYLSLTCDYYDDFEKKKSKIVGTCPLIYSDRLSLNFMYILMFKFFIQHRNDRESIESLAFTVKKKFKLIKLFFILQ